MKPSEICDEEVYETEILPDETTETEEELGSEDSGGTNKSDNELKEYRGFNLQYPQRHNRSRKRKTRPTNYEKGTKKPKPPSGKKSSKQKIYNDPERVAIC